MFKRNFCYRLCIHTEPHTAELAAAAVLKEKTHAQNQLETMSQLRLKVHRSQCWKSKH